MLKERYLQPQFDEVMVGDNAIQLYAEPPLLYLTEQAAATRTKLVGMSWVLAMLSLIVLGCLTYLFLSQGAAGINAGGIQLGAGLNPPQQLLGIGITSLAVILVNIVFNVIAFREKR